MFHNLKINSDEEESNEIIINGRLKTQISFRRILPSLVGNFLHI